MKLSHLLPLGLLCFALGSLAFGGENELSKEESDAGFVLLFNGKDLTGWRLNDSLEQATTLPANWKVEDGCIKVTGGGKPHLGTMKEYADFELRLQWRAARDKYNSGLYIRTGKGLGTNQLNLAKGSEGGLVGGKITGAKPVPMLQKPAGEWNDWRVLAEGDKLSFWCNGQLAWEGTDFTAKQGFIGMQAEGAPIDFRNIRIREIKPAAKP